MTLRQVLGVALCAAPFATVLGVAGSLYGWVAFAPAGIALGFVGCIAVGIHLICGAE